MDHFELHAPFKPTGDQPQAIEKLVAGFKEGNQFQTLLGVTGSGKIVNIRIGDCAYSEYGCVQPNRRKKMVFENHH